MIQYIYFVKCPDCVDEHFDFFDEAKEYAISCLSKKPIITQTEVNRNDFGECIDSCDLGTIWSWEDTMSNITDDKPAEVTFTKDDLCEYDPENDPEFSAIDNSVDFEANTDSLLDGVPDNFRKPIPEGMTIEQLVEAMEENEDTVECVCCNELYPKEDCQYDEKHGWICPDCQDEVVECTWCEELYDRSECRYEVDLGWLCSSCEAAIKSRGETLTFRENNYWDFLDEDFVKAPAIQDSKAIGKFVKILHFGSGDATLFDIKQLLRSNETIRLSTNTINLIAAFDNSCKILQETELGYLISIPCYYRDQEDHSKLQKYPTYINCWVSKKHCEFIDTPAELVAATDESLNEAFNPEELVDFDYTDLDVTLTGNVQDHETGTYDEYEHTVNYTFVKRAQDVAVDIVENFITDEDVADLPGGIEALEDNDTWNAFLNTHFDKLLTAHYDELLEYYKESAIEEYEEKNSQADYLDELEWEKADYYYDSRFDESVSKQSNMLEELEDADSYRAKLSDCPECGSASLDMETGICINCGFNCL